MFNQERKSLEYSEDLQVPPFVRNYLHGETMELEGDEGQRIAEFVISKIAGSDAEAKRRLMVIARLFAGEVLNNDEMEFVENNYFGGEKIDFTRPKDIAYKIAQKMEEGTPEIGKVLVGIGNLINGKKLEEAEKEVLWLFAKEN